MNNNTFFEELRSASDAWCAAKEEREARKRQIIQEFGYKSEEFAAWSKVNNAIKYPFEHGAVKAYKAFESSRENGYDELVMTDFLWDSEAHSFVDALRQAGLKSFIYTNESTACMKNLHAFAAEGCTIAGLVTIEEKSRWASDEPKQIPGVRFTV